MRVFLKSFAKRAANTNDDSVSKGLDFGFWKHHSIFFGIFDDFDEFGPKKSKYPSSIISLSNTISWLSPEALSKKLISGAQIITSSSSTVQVQIIRNAIAYYSTSCHMMYE